MICVEREKAAEMGHTPEPWQTYPSIHNGNSYIVPVSYSGNGSIAHCDTEKTARRIVACVNACAGISTDAMTAIAAAGGVISMTAPAEIYRQRDELLAALESMVDIARLTIGWSCTPANADGPLVVAERLIYSIKDSTP